MNAHDQPPAASAVETETIDDRAAASVLSPGGDANRYEPSTGATARLRSLDAVRGLAIVVMLLAMHPGPQDDPVQLEHPAWHGLRFVDLFFPLFLFSVGVSMAFSSRASNGRQMLRRAALLALLGIAVGSLKHEHFALTGVLQHVAGASVVAFAVLRAPRRWQAPIAAAIVAMVWAGFLIWAAGRDPWGRSDTLAHAVDGALLGGFTSEGVIQTLISSVTVIGGALAGRLIREVPDRGRLVRLIATRGLALIGGGMLLAVLVPLNKRLWSPSFAVLTVGTSYAWLAIGMWLIDVARSPPLGRPLGAPRHQPHCRLCPVHGGPGTAEQLRRRGLPDADPGRQRDPWGPRLRHRVDRVVVVVRLPALPAPDLHQGVSVRMVATASSAPNAGPQMPPSIAHGVARWSVPAVESHSARLAGRGRALRP